MKPILTPCSFSNFSWKRLRISITGDMFTSLNVVRIALLACDCSRRSAMRARSRLIGTRCSGRSPRLAATGAATAGRGFAAAGADGAGGRAAGGAGGRAAGGATGEDVALGDATALAGAGHRADREIVLGHQLGRRGHRDLALDPRQRR